MIKRHCASCNAASAFDLKLVALQHDSKRGTPNYRYSGVFLCQICHRFSVGEWFYGARSSNLDDWIVRFERDTRITTWIPQVQRLPKARTGVPQHIQSANEESYQCLSAGAYRAAVLMARTTIEAVSKDKKITDGNLFQKIDAMHEADLVRKSVKNAAHAIRQFGNDMAHGDIQEEVTKEDAEACLTVLDVILAEVYEVDELASLIKDRVTERNSSPA